LQSPNDPRLWLASNKSLVAVAVPVLLAATAFLGLIAYSMIPPSPAASLFALDQRVKQARSGATTVETMQALDEVASTLEAARRAIKHENEKTWTGRSYDRARTLLWQAEALLEASTSAPAAADRPPGT